MKKCIGYLPVLIPGCLLFTLMTLALLSYPVLFSHSKISVIIVFAGVIVYIVVWKALHPYMFAIKGGLWIGFLFIVNIALEEFIRWQTKTTNMVFTLTMMFLIFCSFFVISGIRTGYTKNLKQGVSSSFASALFGTLIALCFGFFIDFAFSDTMIASLKGYPGYDRFTNPAAFTFFNSFDNASNHIIIAPVIAVIMGILGGSFVLLIAKFRNSKIISS